MYVDVYILKLHKESTFKQKTIENENKWKNAI